MFTGIVEELGRVAERSGSRLRISAQTVLDGSKVGSSIAVNGCCLTVVEINQNSWMTDVSDETFSRTNLGALVVGDVVNLERPMVLGDRLGGHLLASTKLRQSVISILLDDGLQPHGGPHGTQ